MRPSPSFPARTVLHVLKRRFAETVTVALVLGGCTGPSAQPEVGGTDARMPEAAQPRIAFAEVEHDFGVVKQSEGTVQHDFAFTYEGAVPLTITGTPTSCTCTSASANKTTLAPGASGVLAVVFNPNLHAEPPGRFFKTVQILTDPPLPETPEVTIFAQVDLDLGPDAFELRDDHGSDKPHEEPVDSGERSGSATAGHIEAKAIVVSSSNIETLKHEYEALNDALLSLGEKRAVLLILDNHREDLSVYDYGSLASLDRNAAESWTPIEDAMGGHHISGVLIFPKTREAPKELRITGVSVGEIVILLTKSS